jgi:alpha-beta hydrolase superfamily lysophospholipase
MLRFLAPTASLALIAACAVPGSHSKIPYVGQEQARLGPEAAIMADGYRLPFQRWGDNEHPQAVVLALHGFNDYRNAFATLGPFLATQGILTYAYDQRGFGATALRGLWGGEERLISDMRMLSRLVRDRHPEVPFFLVGESMGGAVLMAAASATGKPTAGVILIAPAVWSRDTMNPLQSLVLELAVRTVPWLELTGEGLEIRPSDNRQMLHAFSADPLVIKGTRIDALWGITNIMDRAMAQAHRLPRPALLLYGEQDEIIPADAFCAMLDQLPQAGKGIRVVLYREGWHMLTRDLQGQRVMADIAAWLSDRDGPLPSGEEVQKNSRRLQQFCHG